MTATAEHDLLHPSTPPCLHLLSAFLAMEPTDSLIALARECGGGRVTERVQRFIWDHCMGKNAGKLHAPYLKKFLKKLIAEVELNRGDVLDELYEHYAHFMISLKDSDLERDNARVFKSISFLFPDGCLELTSCPELRKLMVPLQCSLNMLEGDTGCSVWPSSLYLSECILSFPDLFTSKLCFEVGSGVGLVGICLAHVKASKVILSDGDLSTLANMMVNLELNHISVETNMSETTEDPYMVKTVKCLHLPWESVSESELQNLKPDIILGADVIYDPICLPHLVRILALLLNQTKLESKGADGSVNGYRQGNGNGDEFDAFLAKRTDNSATNAGSKKGSIAFIATVIRTIDTFDKFCALLDSANLIIKDVTETLRPSNLLPYMQSYDRTAVRLFAISCK
ncbi:unnamed protein product [Malus baccata var. baccata]